MCEDDVLGYSSHCSTLLVTTLQVGSVCVVCVFVLSMKVYVLCLLVADCILVFGRLCWDYFAGQEP